MRGAAATGFWAEWAHAMKNCSTRSMRKARSTSRLMMNSGSSAVSGGAMKATSTGVTTAVKTSASCAGEGGGRGCARVEAAGTPEEGRASCCGVRAARGGGAHDDDKVPELHGPRRLARVDDVPRVFASRHLFIERRLPHRVLELCLTHRKFGSAHSSQQRARLLRLHCLQLHTAQRDGFARGRGGLESALLLQGSHRGFKLRIGGCGGVVDDRWRLKRGPVDRSPRQADRHRGRHPRRLLHTGLLQVYSALVSL